MFLALISKYICKFLREESSGEQRREDLLEILTGGDSDRPPSRPIRQHPPPHTTLSQSKDWSQESQGEVFLVKSG
jgi:hypothetical protein